MHKRRESYFGHLALELMGMALIVFALDAAAQTGAPVAPATHSATLSTTADGLDWQQLTTTQHQALQPLAVSWPHLSETQKKNWIALSTNFHTLSAASKARLHARMAEWAALTPRQRTQARLNYSQTQQLPLEDKAERWEVYQTLTPEQKRALAESAPKVPLAPQVTAPKAAAH